MKILIVTPVKRGSTKGNRITAERYRSMLRGLGHRVTVAESYDPVYGNTSSQTSFDLLIALHARRSSPSVLNFKQRFPCRPVIVVMTGTDLHWDMSRTRVVETCLSNADQIVLLEPNGVSKLKKKFRDKSTVIFQSSKRIQSRPVKLKRRFEVSLLGHLRPVKDPFRTAMAARLLPKESRIRIVHFGQALTPKMEQDAIEESAQNPRYRWHGEVSHGVALRRLARSRLTVLSSKSEGGPAVVSEAIVNDVPILATRIDATLGILGPNYPGLFEIGDTKKLAELMHRAETEPEFLLELKSAMAKVRPKFLVSNEIKMWKSVLKAVSNCRLE